MARSNAIRVSKMDAEYTREAILERGRKCLEHYRRLDEAEKHSRSRFQFNLTTMQVLLAIASNPGTYGKEISQKEGISGSTVQRQIVFFTGEEVNNSLSRPWVEWRAAVGDKRTRCLYLTDEGARQLSYLLAPFAAD